jgi:glycosyltransferase involved in cell wall biosynthesis
MIKTLILPAYNEEKYIADIVNRGKKYADRVIVIDNNSSDNTFIEAQKAGAITLHHKSNLGKAGSLKTGCEAAIKLGTEIIAFMDSDGQHKPEDLPRFYELFTNEELDIVIGSRKGGDKMPFVRKVGTNLLMYVTRLLFKVDIKDIQSGYRVFRADIYPTIKWNSSGSSHYFADAEITVRIGLNKLRYKEIFIDTIFIDEYKGMNPLEGLKLLLTIIIWRFSL